MDKPKELVLIIEKTPRLATYASEHEKMQYSSEHTDEDPTSLLSGKTQQRSTAAKANRKSEVLCVPFVYIYVGFLKTG